MTIRDGLGLPAWVLMYAEYEGRIVRLADDAGFRRAAGCEVHSSGGRYSVGGGRPLLGWKHPCELCGAAIARTGQPYLLHLMDTDAYDEAVAEFRRQEALLLGRET